MSLFSILQSSWRTTLYSYLTVQELFQIRTLIVPKSLYSYLSWTDEQFKQLLFRMPLLYNRGELLYIEQANPKRFLYYLCQLNDLQSVTRFIKDNPNCIITVYTFLNIISNCHIINRNETSISGLNENILLQLIESSLFQSKAGIDNNSFYNMNSTLLLDLCLKYRFLTFLTKLTSQILSVKYHDSPPIISEENLNRHLLIDLLTTTHISSICKSILYPCKTDSEVAYLNHIASLNYKRIIYVEKIFHSEFTTNTDQYYPMLFDGLQIVPPLYFIRDVLRHNPLYQHRLRKKACVCPDLYACFHYWYFQQNPIRFAPFKGWSTVYPVITVRSMDHGKKKNLSNPPFFPNPK